MWLKSGNGLEESHLFEQALYRDLRDSYQAAKSPVELLDRLMRDAYVAIRPNSRKITHSRCVALYLPVRLGWWVDDVRVSQQHSIRSIQFGSWWVPIPNDHLPFQFSVQRLLARWFFEIGEHFGLSSAIRTQAEQLRGKDGQRQAGRLPAWTAIQRVAPAANRPLEGLDVLYRAGALHLIEAKMSCAVDTARRLEGDSGPNYPG